MMVKTPRITTRAPLQEHGAVRLFRERPGKYVIEEFLTHVRRTGCPETFPGIYTDALDRSERFE
jgi:hypothetical protein